jgi:hypothetical protein
MTGEDVAASEQAATTTCATNGGVFPTKAALAVAMGIELQRFQPAKDLVNMNYQYTTLNSSASCKVNGCKNTKAILGLQFVDYSQLGGSQVFDTTTYRTELVNGFAYQTTLNNVARSRGKAQPPDHKATLISGPVDLGTQACGLQYVFDITKPDGVTQLTQAEKDSMVYWFCFFGQAPSGAADVGVQCSNNPYVGFIQTNVSCPAGHYCIAIDPDPGDTGTTSSTTSGAAPTYPMNRLYVYSDDSGNSPYWSQMLNTPCTKTTGLVTTLKPKTNVTDYLFCQ